MVRSIWRTSPVGEGPTQQPSPVEDGGRGVGHPGSIFPARGRGWPSLAQKNVSKGRESRHRKHFKRRRCSKKGHQKAKMKGKHCLKGQNVRKWRCVWKSSWLMIVKASCQNQRWDGLVPIMSATKVREAARKERRYSLRVYLAGWQIEADCASEPLHGPDCAKRTASHIKMKARGVCDLAPVQKHATMTRLERKPGQPVVTGTRFFHAYMAHSKLASHSNADRNPTHACYNRKSRTLCHAIQR